MLRALSSRMFVLTAAIVLAPFAVQAQATSTVTCKDGTTSTATGRGACSGHGGVNRTPKKATKTEAKADTKIAKTEAKADTKVAKAETKADTKAAKATSKSERAAEKATSKAVASDLKETRKTANATAANTDPTDATAKCKDGTYSHAATHRGACSRHGGVAEWLKS